MLDALRRAAEAIRFLRGPALAAAALCLGSIAVRLVRSSSVAEDRWLMPSFIGLLWALGVLSFIGTFRAVPEPLPPGARLWPRVGHAIRRAAYWLLALVFAVATTSALVLTSRLITVWLDEQTAG